MLEMKGLIKLKLSPFWWKQLFNAFQLSWKVSVSSVPLAVCLSIRSPIHANTLWISTILINVTEVYYIAYPLLRLKYVAVLVHLQRCIKEFDCIMVYGYKSFEENLMMLRYFKHYEIGMHLWVGLKQALYRVWSE